MPGMSLTYRLTEIESDGNRRELGQYTLSPQQQATEITDLLAAIAKLDYAGPAFIYSIRDNDFGNRGDRETNFGALLTSDWQPKPAAAALAR